jgi:hypothetical protein
MLHSLSPGERFDNGNDVVKRVPPIAQVLVPGDMNREHDSRCCKEAVQEDLTFDKHLHLHGLHLLSADTLQTRLFEPCCMAW